MDKNKILSPIAKEIEEKAEKIKSDLREITTNYKELVKQRTSIPGYIEEVKRFET